GGRQQLGAGRRRHLLRAPPRRRRPGPGAASLGRRPRERPARTARILPGLGLRPLARPDAAAVLGGDVPRKRPAPGAATASAAGHARATLNRSASCPAPVWPA